jgi:hypothetical protein
LLWGEPGCEVRGFLNWAEGGNEGGADKGNPADNRGVGGVRYLLWGEPGRGVRGFPELGTRGLNGVTEGSGASGFLVTVMASEESATCCGVNLANETRFGLVRY